MEKAAKCRLQGNASLVVGMARCKGWGKAQAWCVGRRVRRVKASRCERGVRQAMEH